MRRTLFRYLLVEQVVPLFVSLFVLTIVLFLGKSMRYTKLLFASGSGLADLGKLLFYSTPYFLAFTIPMATLLAVLLAFTRLAHDNEITAMKAAGISFYQMIPPVAIITGCAWVISLGLSLFVLPSGNSALERVLLELAQSRLQLGLKERVFNNQFDGLVFFVNHISSDGRQLQEVFISDERSPDTKSTIIAERGQLLTDMSRKLFTISLFKGTILRVREEMHSAQTIQFQNYDFQLDLTSIFKVQDERHKGRGEMSMSELRQALARHEPGSEFHNAYLLQWHRRFSLPFACVVLGFIAAPLSVQSRTGSRLSGVVLGLFLFWLYYMVFSAAKAFGESGIYPPAVGMWLPNVVFGILAIFLWIKTARESPFGPIVICQQFAESMWSRLKARQKCDCP